MRHPDEMSKEELRAEVDRLTYLCHVNALCQVCGTIHISRTPTPEELSESLRQIRANLPRSTEFQAYREMRESLDAAGKKPFLRKEI